MMTHETLIENVKQRYANAGPATLAALLHTLQEANVDLHLPETSSERTTNNVAPRENLKPRAFVGEHLTLEEYRRLSLNERFEHKRRLKEQNQRWLEEKFASLHAAWLMVLEGEVIGYGETMRDYPRVEQIREVGSRYGKRPFLFINDLVVAVEESFSKWRATVYRDDFYPTVPITLHTDAGSLSLTADFDTGAASSFVDYDLLSEQAMLEINGEDEEAEVSIHLGEGFRFFSKSVTIEVEASNEGRLRRNVFVACVLDWNRSPFVRINPRRSALAGRDLFLQLKSRVLLDLGNRRTSVRAAAA
jgi:hypothetical protein